MWEVFAYAGDSRGVGPADPRRRPDDAGRPAAQPPRHLEHRELPRDRRRGSRSARSSARTSGSRSLGDFIWKTDHVITFADAGVDRDDDERPRQPGHGRGQSAPRAADRPRRPSLSRPRTTSTSRSAFRAPYCSESFSKCTAKRPASSRCSGELRYDGSGASLGESLPSRRTRRSGSSSRPLKAAGGTVDLHTILDELGKGELQAALVVLHLDGELATAAAEVVPRLTGDARVIAVLPRTNLPAVVDIMQSSRSHRRHAGRRRASTAPALRDGDARARRRHLRPREDGPRGARRSTASSSATTRRSRCASRRSREFAEHDGRAPQVPRGDRAVPRRDADERALRRAGRRAGQADLRRDPDEDADLAARRAEGRRPVRVRRPARSRSACATRSARSSAARCYATSTSACTRRAADRSQGRRRGPRPVPDGQLGDARSTSTCCPASRPRRCACSISRRRSCSSSSFGFFTEKIDAARPARRGRLAPACRAPQHPVERRRGTDPHAAPPPPRALIAVLGIAILAVLGLAAAAAWPRLFPHKVRRPVHAGGRCRLSEAGVRRARCRLR